MRSILVICVLIGLAAVAAPHVFTYYVHKPVADSAASVSEVTPDSDKPQPAPGVRQVAIQAERDGHFYVEADINNRPVRLMVDTGATVVALRASDAASAGIRPLPADYTDPVQTANGKTMAAEAILDRIVIEDIELHHIRALVVPDDQLSLSLLGGSFLNGLQRFQVADGTLIFEN
jgi:aspartyl protease family protein